MYRPGLLAAMALTLPLAGASLVLVHDQSSGDLLPVETEVPYGATPATDAVGLNATNGSASVSGSLTTVTTDVFYINNTNTSGVHYVKLELVEVLNKDLLSTLKLGIDNGTKTLQIEIDTGSLLSSEGTYVRLEPGSTNTIYATYSLSSLTSDPELVFWTYSADDASESAYVKSRGRVTILS